MKLYTTLETVLKTEPNYVTDDGNLKKWVVINKAQNYDAELLALLLENEELKKRYFKPVAGALVFDQNGFINFLEQKNYLNDSYTAYKNKVGLNIDGKYLKQRNEVSLVWPFKDCVLEGGQSREEDKREEIFFNETLAQDEITQLLEPKVLTNAKRYTINGIEFPSTGGVPEGRGGFFNRNENGTITDNLIIKGNNLLALHSLKEEFAGKVKLIYIDPPFNTGNDSFKYNDSFNQSTWLTFISNRLKIAKELLSDSGILMVQCDYNESAYLKILIDEIFGRNNFVNTISIQSSTPSGVKISHADKKILKSQDFIHVFKKNQICLNPQYIKKAKWDTHYMYYIDLEKNELQTMVNVLKQKKILEHNQNINDFNINNENHKKFYIKNGDYIVRKSTHDNKQIKEICNNQYNNQMYKSDKGHYFLNDDMLQPISKSFHEVFNGQNIELNIANLLCDFWHDIDFQNTQNQGGVSFPAGKKPEQLLYRIIKMCTNEKDIVLDFHLGSGTTSATSHKLRRQYIGIEQMDYIETVAVERLKKVIEGEQGGISKSVNWQGGGEFVYIEHKKYNQTFIEQIASASSTTEILEIWEQMKAKSFLNYNVDIQKQEQHIEEFKALTLAEQKQHLVELLDKNQLYVNLSSLHDKDFAVSAEEKKVTQDFYQIKK